MSNNYLTKKKEYVLQLESKYLVLNDLSSEARIAALEKITDQKTIAKVALNDKDYRVRMTAVRKLTDSKTINKIALHDVNSQVRSTAALKVKSQRVRNMIDLNSPYPKVRIAAVERITSQNLLKDIALTDENVEVRLAAFYRIKKDEILKDIALKSEWYIIRVRAVALIKDKEEIKDIIDLYIQSIITPPEINEIYIDSDVLAIVVKKLGVEEVIKHLDLNNKKYYLRKEIVFMFKHNKKILENILSNEENSELREVIEKLLIKSH